MMSIRVIRANPCNRGKSFAFGFDLASSQQQVASS
jgi:hypothetical protein